MHDVYAEDKPHQSRPSDRYDMPLGRHRRTQSHHLQSSLPITLSSYWDHGRTNRDPGDELLSRPNPHDFRAHHQSAHFNDSKTRRPSTQDGGDEALCKRKAEREDTAPDSVFELDNHLKHGLQLSSKDLVNDRCREPPCNDHVRPKTDDQIAYGRENTRVEWDPIENWLFHSSGIDDKAQSTNTETVVDNSGSRPSQGYFRVFHQTPREYPAQKEKGGASAYDLTSRQAHFISPTRSNTSTETVVADNRIRHNKGRIMAHRDEGGQRTRKGLIKLQQDEEARCQQEVAMRSRQEKEGKMRQNTDLPAFLRESFAKVPERTGDARQRWPYVEYSQGIGKASQSKTPYSKTNIEAPRTRGKDSRHSYKDYERYRSQSTGADGTGKRMACPSGGHWAYSGLPINYVPRNPSEASADKKKEEPVAAAKNVGYTRDIMEYRARDNGGP